MLIRIPHSWLLDFIQTKATPKQIAEKLSLTSFSVERLEKSGNDTIYIIEPPPNRGDLLSVMGIAREVAASLPQFGIKAALKSPFPSVILSGAKDPLKTGRDSSVATLPQNDGKGKGGKTVELPLKVTIKNKSLCPRFSALILNNVKTKPSPKLIRDRLNKVGVRDLNNVIDVTNYLMIELGQPMHAFDYDKIKNAEMILRESKKGEKITTLDGIKRALPEGVIVIEDGSGRLIDLCGIMGGLNSEIDENTKRVLLFVQVYDPLRIRKATQVLAHRTEAAARFEKGIDFEGVIPSLEHAAAMLKENAEAKIASKLIDIVHEKPSRNWIKLESEKINQIIGQKIGKAEMVKILESLDFEIIDRKVRAPSWRNDTFEGIEDLAEEVARIYGYHNLPAIVPEGKLPEREAHREFYWESKMKYFLKHQGFFELYTNSATNKTHLEKVGIDPKKALRLLNPLSEDFEYLRPSLLPQLLLTLSENENHADEIRLFELAPTYLPSGKEKELPVQKMKLTGVLTSRHPDPERAGRVEGEGSLANARSDIRQGFFVANAPQNDGGEELFLKTKGSIETLLQELGIMNYEFREMSDDPEVLRDSHLRGVNLKTPWYKTVAEAVIKNKVLGHIGLLKLEIASNFGLEKPVAAFDLDFETLTKLATIDRQFTPIPELPPVIEDISIIVDYRSPVGPIIKSIEKLSTLNFELLICLVDIYHDPKLGPNKKSITFQVTYQALKKQLLGKEIKEIRGKIVGTLKKEYKAELRSL